MDRDILGACGYDAGGIKSHYGIRDGFSLWSASSCAAGRESAGSSTYRAVSGVKLASNIACLITVPCSCVFDASSRPTSERLHLWKKVMKVHQDRQLRVCTHAQAQIQCRYAYLPKIGRHQNQTRSAGHSSPPVVDLYRQTHLARSELLRTPRHTSIYQGQFYP